MKTLLALLACATAVHAQSIPIQNASFESPPTGPGTFITNAPPPGWAAYGSLNFGARTIGVVNPSSTNLYAVPPPHGANVGVTFLLDDIGNQTVFAGIEAGLHQTLLSALEPATRYTLTVHVGNMAADTNPPHNQFQFTGFPGYRVELRAGAAAIAIDANTLLPGEGQFQLATLHFDVGATHANLGQPLAIRLVNLNAAPGIEVNFDDVRLVATDLSIGVVSCAGDGTGTACPCANSGAAGAGCANSTFAAGARLAAVGVASVAADSVVLAGTRMPNSSALYFQGTSSAAGGAGTVFGDGLRCAAGAVIRLGTKTNVSASSSYPELGDAPISVRGAIPVGGGTRTYQVWYRNAAAFCTASTFNLTNGLEIAWGA